MHHLFVFAVAVLLSSVDASAARGTDDCEYANNGFCDDAGLWKMFYDNVMVREKTQSAEYDSMDSASNLCSPNTDVSDCGVHVLCENSCALARNGVCDVECEVGTDCEDCGTSLAPVEEFGSSEFLTDLMRRGRASTCDDSCDFANNGVCDYSHTFRDPWLSPDDDQGAWTTCKPGTDCSDCGVTIECSNTCDSANDGVCDEIAGRGSGSKCGLGTDCNDCGPYLNVNSPYTPRGEEEEDLLAGVYYSASCDDSCATANNGVCEYLMWEWEDDYETWFTNVGDAWCAWGTDCSDCESMVWPNEVPKVTTEHFVPSENNLLCTDTCHSSSNGVCDYRPMHSSEEAFIATASRADYSAGVDLVCDWGSDCSDCQSWYVGFVEIGIVIEEEEQIQEDGESVALTETSQVSWDFSFASSIFSGDDEEDTDEFPNTSTILETVWSIVESLISPRYTPTDSRMSYEQEMLASA